MGSHALPSNASGSYNSASGAYALYFNFSGSNNTALGSQSLYNNNSGYSNTAVGSSAIPYNTSGYQNTSIGYQSLYFSTTGNNNTAVGIWALSNVSTGSNNIGLGYDAQVPSASGNNQVRLGNSGISYAGIQVGWSITSDRRLKSDIADADLGLDFIRKLHPVSYYRTNDEGNKTEYGFIAQEVEETLANAGATNTGMITKDDEGMYSLRYNDMIAPMVKAIQDQQAMIESLKAQNQELIQRIEKIEKEHQNTK